MQKENLQPKNLKEKIKRFFWKSFFSIIYFFGFRLKIYQYWSELYRNLYHSEYKNEIPKNLTPEHAQNIMNQVRWRRDGVLEFWDAIGSPNWFQYLYEEIIRTGEQPDGAVDCDEYAFWAANTVSGKFSPKVLTVTWLECYRNEKGKLKYRMSGHHVCLLYDDFYFHIGNWGKSKKYHTKQELISSILSQGINAESKIESAIMAEWLPSCSIKDSSWVVR